MMAEYASTRTTQIHNRGRGDVMLGEVERVRVYLLRTRDHVKVVLHELESLAKRF